MWLAARNHLTKFNCSVHFDHFSTSHYLLTSLPLTTLRGKSVPESCHWRGRWRLFRNGSLRAMFGNNFVQIACFHQMDCILVVDDEMRQTSRIPQITCVTDCCELSFTYGLSFLHIICCSISGTFLGNKYINVYSFQIIPWSLPPSVSFLHPIRSILDCCRHWGQDAFQSFCRPVNPCRSKVIPISILRNSTAVISRFFTVYEKWETRECTDTGGGYYCIIHWDNVDWRLASLRFPLALIDFVPEIIEELSKEEVIEMRRRGRVFLSRIDDAEGQ